MNYQLVEGPDKTVWVSLQPLVSDVNDMLQHIQTIDLETLSTIDKDIMEFNMIGLKAISTFLSALVQESKQNEYNANTNRQTTH